ncbi:MAG: MoaD/ThiS family protein [Thermoanaerobaculia bacterium]|nr:MoaD/ThiS family protein [Thermoanaerobaculia bacterium]
MRVPVSVPSLLLACTGGAADLEVEADTLAGALDRLLEAYPLLGPRLYEEDGTQREHVRIFYNDESTLWLDSLDVPLRAGDRITILQAVSGG